MMSPCPFGAGEVPSRSSICRIGKCCFSCWHCGAHAGACFTWAVELCLLSHSISRTPLYRAMLMAEVTLHHACHAWSPHAALESALRLFFSPVSLILVLLVASCFSMTEGNGQCSSWVTNIFLIVAPCNLFPNRTQAVLGNVFTLDLLTFSLPKQGLKLTCSCVFYDFVCLFVSFVRK